MRRLLAALAVSLALPGAAMAQASKASDLEVLTDVSLSTIEPVLRNAGLQPETVTIGNQESLVVRSGQLQMILRPTVCRPQCTGLLMYTLFQGTAPASVINAYNEGTPPTVAYTAQGNTVLSRYLIADHGITKGSFMVNLVVFDNTVSKWLSARSASNALSVSLAGPDMPDSNDDAEGEEFLNALMDRPELYSGTPSREDY